MIINSVFGFLDDNGIPMTSGNLFPCLVVCLKQPPDDVFEQNGLFPFYLGSRNDLFDCMEEVDCIIMTDDMDIVSILQEHNRYFLFWDWVSKTLTPR